MAKKYYKRTFLNKKEGVALIESRVSTDENGFKDAGVKITDCNRQVSLEFNFWNVETKDNTQYKINKLIEELEAFRAALFPAPVQKE